MTHLAYQMQWRSRATDPNRDPWAQLAVRFVDGSQITLVYRGTDPDGRQRYAYTVNQPQIPRTVAAGHDLRSGVGAPIDFLAALAAWVSFGSADAEAYRAAMTGDAWQEWAYLHDDELAMVAVDLEQPNEDGA
jgi:hypothetical protein